MKKEKQSTCGKAAMPLWQEASLKSKIANMLYPNEKKKLTWWCLVKTKKNKQPVQRRKNKKQRTGRWSDKEKEKQLTCAAATGPSGVPRMMMPPSIDANSCPGKDYLHRTTTPGV